MRCAFSSGRTEQVAYRSLPPGRGAATDPRAGGTAPLPCDVRRPAQDLDIGMSADDPGPRAGGVDEHAVEEMAVPENAGIGGIAGHDPGFQPEPFQGARYLHQSAGVFVHRHEAGQGRALEEMRRLAAGRRAGVEDMVTGPNVEQRRRKLGSRVLDGDRPHSETGQRRRLHWARQHQPLIGMGARGWQGSRRRATGQDRRRGRRAAR